MIIQYPHWDDFDEEHLQSLIDQFKAYEQGGNPEFFQHFGISVTYREMNEFLTDRKMTNHIWLVLLEYLKVYATKFKHIVPQFRLLKYTIRGFDEITEVQEQESEKQIVIVNIYGRYVLLIFHNLKLCIVDFCNVEDKYMMALKKELKIQEVYTITDKLAPHYYFSFAAYFIQGKKLENIKFTPLNDRICFDRVAFIILRIGFSEIDIVMGEMSERSDKEAIVKFKQDQVRQLIKVNRNIEFGEPRIDKMKVNTFQLPSYDDDFRRIDQMKQMQLQFKSSSLTMLRNASEILKGNIHEEIFRGMGIQPDPKLLLDKLREKNREIILDPLPKRQVPGAFVSKPKELIISQRYGIQITHTTINEFRQGFVSDDIIDFYSSFLQEFCKQNLIMNKYNLLSYIEDLPQYLPQFDRTLYPIKLNQQEVCLIIIDQVNFKIYYYFLSALRINEIKPLHGVMKAWAFAPDVESENLMQKRTELQTHHLKIVIKKIEQDMRLWKIRLDDIMQVSARQTRLYLLTIMTLFAFGGKIDQPMGQKIIQTIVEHIICSAGIGEKKVYQSGFDYLIKQINIKY